MFEAGIPVAADGTAGNRQPARAALLTVHLLGGLPRRIFHTGIGHHRERRGYRRSRRTGRQFVGVVRSHLPVYCAGRAKGRRRRQTCENSHAVSWHTG